MTLKFPKIWSAFPIPYIPGNEPDHHQCFLQCFWFPSFMDHGRISHLLPLEMKSSRMNFFGPAIWVEVTCHFYFFLRDKILYCVGRAVGGGFRMGNTCTCHFLNVLFIFGCPELLWLGFLQSRRTEAALHHAGFFSCGAWALECVGFGICRLRVLERRFNSCGAQV